ncbi:MAG: hypothetical protein AAGA32_21805 [Pseudomonadota bacterium]
MIKTAVAGLALLALIPSVSFAGGGHDHSHGGMATVSEGQAAPTLALDASPDTMSGYNLHLMVENFTFSPERTGVESDAVEGHAHLYVNDVKVGRVYGTWVYLSGEMLPEAENTVRVTLNDNMHRDWMADGAVVAAEVVLPGTAMSAGHDHSAHHGHKSN